MTLPQVGSSPNEKWSTYLAHTRELAEQLVHADDPYDVGLRFVEDGIDLSAVDQHAGKMYALWGALTDWGELRPAEKCLASTEMVRAAREWLELDPNDSEAVNRYFDHWLHDICGYKRL